MAGRGWFQRAQDIFLEVIVVHEIQTWYLLFPAVRLLCDLLQCCVHDAQAAEVLLDWLWFSVASSSASFAAVNPLLLQQQTGEDHPTCLMLSPLVTRGFSLVV